MEQDCLIKRARFIDSSIQVREAFGFANPEELLKIIGIYCCDLYGSALWDLYGPAANQFYKCWNTSVKLCWDLPRMTHTHFVKGFLSCNLKTLRIQCIARYSKFIKSLIESSSNEVCILARIVSNDVSTNTGKNILNIKLETRESPAVSLSKNIEECLMNIDKSEPSVRWDVWLLEKYIAVRQDLCSSMNDTEYIDDLISSLCSS